MGGEPPEHHRWNVDFSLSRLDCYTAWSSLTLRAARKNTVPSCSLGNVFIPAGYEPFARPRGEYNVP